MSTDTSFVTDFEAIAEELRSTHIVTPSDNPSRWVQVAQHRRVSLDRISGQDIVDFCRANGFAVKTLCGYIFIPERDPEKYDACGPCMEIAEQRMKEAGE